MAKRVQRRASPRAATRAVGRPTLALAAAMRERVIAAARVVFLERGFDAASLEEIAREAGVHRDTLYRRYGDKAKLFHAVVWSLMSGMRNGLARAVADGGRPHVVLTRVASRFYADATSRESVAATRMVTAASQRFPKLAASAHEGWVADLAPLIDYLESQRVAGALQLDDASQAAYAFANAIVLPLRVLLASRLNDAALQAHLKRAVELHLAGWHAKTWRIKASP